MSTFKLSHYSGIIIKAIDIVLLTLLVNVAFVTLIRVESDLPIVFDQMVALGFCIYFISAITTSKWQFKVKYHELLLPIMGIVTVTIVVLLGLNQDFALYKMTTYAAYILIWIFGSNFKLKHDRITPTRNRFYWSLIGLSVIFYLIFPFRIEGGFDNITKIYFPIYCIISLLNLNLVNMRSAYELMESKAINKDINVSRFSTIALTVAIGLVLVAQSRLWSFVLQVIDHLRNFIIIVIKGLVYPLAMLLEFLVHFIRSFGPNASQTETVVEGMFGNRSSFNTGIVREGTEIAPWMELALGILSWSIIGLISLIMLYKVYQRVASRAMINQSSGQEERNFVFSFKESLSEMMSSLHRNKEDFEQPSDMIRIQYRLALIEWKKMGFEKLKNQTPNEFLEMLKGQSMETDTFENLTKNYNALRYGGE